METDSDNSPSPESDGETAPEKTEAPSGGLRDPFVRRAILVAALPPLVFLVVSLSWYRSSPSGMVYTGYLQGDQLTYTAFARAVFDRGNGLVYANPFDFDPKAPQVLTNLGYVALAWLFKLTGGHAVVGWEVWRVVFGTACYALFAMLVARLFCSTRLRWFVFLIGIFGAGAAWIVTAFGYAALPDLGIVHAFARAEEGYDFWCLNLFRQSLYPLELAYHALFFAALLLYLSRRHFGLLAVVFLLWWTHPVTAILTTTVVGLALAGDWCCKREFKELLALAGLVCVVLPWMYYYCIFLPRYPSIQIWIEQTMAYGAFMKMHLSYWPRAWGILLVGLAAAPVVLVAAIVNPALRRYVWKERSVRLLLFWGLAAMAWSHNNLVLPERPIQPMHFTRGYIYLFLLLATVKGLQLLWENRPLDVGTRRVVMRLAPALMLLLMIDNVLFVARLATEPPKKGLLMIRREDKEVLDYFRQQPASLGIVSSNVHLGTLLVAQTPHRVFASERALTPWSRERFDAEQRFFASGNPEATRRWGVDRVIIVRVEGFPNPRWTLDPKRFRVLFDNEIHQVGEMIDSSGEGNGAANR